ncbi:MAG TPA: sterol desaturase family protein, partial [Pirellulales bacterium]
DTLVNTAGHTGYEIVPKPVSQNWFFKFFNTVTHHDAHHTNVHVNYGSFFNLWDRWMGTFEDDVTPAAQSAIPREMTDRCQTAAFESSASQSYRPANGKFLSPASADHR